MSDVYRNIGAFQCKNFPREVAKVVLIQETMKDFALNQNLAKISRNFSESFFMK